MNIHLPCATNLLEYRDEGTPLLIIWYKPFNYANPTPIHAALARVHKSYKRTSEEENKILPYDSFLYSFLVDRLYKKLTITSTSPYTFTLKTVHSAGFKTTYDG